MTAVLRVVVGWDTRTTRAAAITRETTRQRAVAAEWGLLTAAERRAVRLRRTVQHVAVLVAAAVVVVLVGLLQTWAGVA